MQRYLPECRRIRSPASPTPARICKGCKDGPRADRPHGAAAADRTGLSQQALATRLGISASYLNLIEHDQRAVTASLLIKLGETLRVDLGDVVRHARSASSRSGCARPSPTRCWAPTRCRRRKSRQLAAGSAECRAGGAGAVSRLARGAGGCRRHRAALRPPRPAAERGGARFLRRSRQPFSDAGRRRPKRWPGSWRRPRRPK